MGLKFLYKLRSNTTESLNTVDDKEDEYYEINEGATKPSGVRMRKLKQGYLKELRKVEVDHLAQQPPTCYSG